MPRPKVNGRTVPVFIRAGEAQDELIARAAHRGIGVGNVMSSEWRTTREKWALQLALTRTTRAIRPSDVPYLLDAWPYDVDYQDPDKLRQLISRSLGYNDTLVRRIVGARDVAIIALGWGVVVCHAYINKGIDMEQAAEMAGLIP